MNKLPQKLAPLVLAAFSLLPLSCATPSGSRALPPPEEDPSFQIEKEVESSSRGDAQAFRAIRDQYSKKQFNSLPASSVRFKKRFPKSPFLPQVLNIEGLVSLDRKDFSSSISSFQRALELVGREDRLRDYLLYNLATTHYQMDQAAEAEKYLSSIRVASLDRHTRLKYFYLQSLVSTKLQNYTVTLRTILSMEQALAEKVSEKTRESFLAPLQTALENTTSWGTIETLLNEHPNTSFSDEVLVHSGRLAKGQGDWDRAAHYFRKIVQEYPQSIHLIEANDFLATLEHQSLVDRKLVGLLLPMTGKYARFGQNSLEAISLAFRVHDVNRRGESPIQLVIEDAGETPEQALAALNKLFFDHHVVAILGPLLGKDSEQLFVRAEDLGVPLLALTQKGSSPGTYVFHTSVTPEAQAKEIARFAVEDQGLKRFAIAYPNDSFGIEYMNAFWNSVESFGGEIVAAEDYTSRQTDFKTVVDKLSGLHYLGARQRELDELEQLRKTEKITKRSSRTEAYFRLPPIIEYDAVFIPDEARTVAQLLPTFSYRDVESVNFLGISTWNSSMLLRRANDQLSKSFFVDMFFVDDPHPNAKRFVSQFEKTFQRPPSALEAQAYDAALLLDHALLSNYQSMSRSELRDRLMKISDFAGVTGKLSYRDGRFERPLKILSVERNNFKQIQ